MKNNYFYKLKERLRIKDFDTNQPKNVWIFVITLNQSVEKIKWIIY